MTVAIIDDDLIHQFIMKKMITSHMPLVNILIFNDGQQAADYFALCRQEIQLLPELIFLDINMPHLDGWQFLEALRALHLPNYIPMIYMLSSSIDQDDHVKSTFFPELSNFFSKPISRGLLASILDQYS